MKNQEETIEILKDIIDKMEEFTNKVVFKKQNLEYYDLNRRINTYLKWYSKNIVEGNPKNLPNLLQVRELSNFIDKMAVWYELRYPSIYVNQIIQQNVVVPAEKEESAYPYLKEWKDLFIYQNFRELLENDEIMFMRRPSFFLGILFLNEELTKSYTKRLESVGIRPEKTIKISSRGTVITNDIDERLNGKYIKEVRDILIRANILDKNEKHINNLIVQYEDECIAKQELLNSVMYRIMERGGNRVGARRAMLFALEFKLDISIPMTYGYDSSDYNMRQFMNFYLAKDGSRDIEMITNYFCRNNKNEALEFIRFDDAYCSKKNYTKEEKELYQRMVNVLSVHNQDVEQNNPERKR